MSARPILVLYAAPVWRDDEALELLRVTAALVACGHPVRLAETARVLQGEDLPDEAERLLQQLAAFGVVPEPFEASALQEARAVLRVGAADRSGTPPVATGAETGADVLAEAGQLLR